MTIIPLEDLTYNTTNLSEDTTPSWDIDSGYSLGTTRQRNNRLYQALGDINPLCDYIYDNTDPLNIHYTTDVHGVEVLDNTAVACVQNETVVYVVDNGNFYIYNSTSSNVDFTTEDINSPSNFTTTTNYRSLIYYPEETPLKWEDLGYTNKYRCLDDSISTQTVSDTDITMSFVLSKVDTVTLLNVLADSVRVKVTQIDSSTVLYDETISTTIKEGATWYDYFYADYTFLDKLSSEIPIDFNVQIDITIIAGGNGAKVGLVAIGRSIYIGDSLFGSGIGMIDFSKKQSNSKGETYLEQGNFKSTNSLSVDVPSGLTDFVINTLVDYRSVPIVFKTDGFNSFTIFGIYTNFDLLVSLPSVSKLSIDLESLT